MEGVMTNRVGDVDALELALGYWVPAVLERSRAGLASASKVPKKSVNVMDGVSALGDGNDDEQLEGAAGSPGPEAAISEAMQPGARLMSYLSPTAAHAEFDACKTAVNAERLNPGSLTANAALSTASGTRTNALRRTTSQPHRPRLPIRLIVLDSITALLRGAETAFSSSSAGLTARSRFLCNTADRLKALAVEYNLAVVVINQVSDVIDRRGMTGFTAKDQDEEDEEAEEEEKSGPSHTSRQSDEPSNGSMRPPALPVDHTAAPSSQVRPSQAHPSSSQSQPGVTHSQAWATKGPDPPMLYATQSKWFSGQSSARTKEAALGVVWANAINVRLMLSRTGRRRVIGQDDVEEGVERGTKRRLMDGYRAAGDESGVAMAQARADRLAGISRRAPVEGAGFGAAYASSASYSFQNRRSASSAAAAASASVSAAAMIDADDVRLEWADEEDPAEEERILIRRAQCVFSPHAASATIDYVITTSGIHSLSGTWKREDTGEEVLKRQKRLRAAMAAGHQLPGDGAYMDGDADGHGNGDPYDEEGMYGDIADGSFEGVPEGWWNGNVGTAAQD